MKKTVSLIYCLILFYNCSLNYGKKNAFSENEAEIDFSKDVKSILEEKNRTENLDDDEKEFIKKKFEKILGNTCREQEGTYEGLSEEINKYCENEGYSFIDFIGNYYEDKEDFKDELLKEFIKNQEEKVNVIEKVLKKLGKEKIERKGKVDYLLHKYLKQKFFHFEDNYYYIIEDYCTRVRIIFADMGFKYDYDDLEYKFNVFCHYFFLKLMNESCFANTKMDDFFLCFPINLKESNCFLHSCFFFNEKQKQHMKARYGFSYKNDFLKQEHIDNFLFQSRNGLSYPCVMAGFHIRKVLYDNDYICYKLLSVLNSIYSMIKTNKLPTHRFYDLVLAPGAEIDFSKFEDVTNMNLEKERAVKVELEQGKLCRDYITKKIQELIPNSTIKYEDEKEDEEENEKNNKYSQKITFVIGSKYLGILVSNNFFPNDIEESYLEPSLHPFLHIKPVFRKEDRIYTKNLKCFVKEKFKNKKRYMKRWYAHLGAVIRILAKSTDNFYSIFYCNTWVQTILSRESLLFFGMRYCKDSYKNKFFDLIQDSQIIEMFDNMNKHINTCLEVFFDYNIEKEKKIRITKIREAIEKEKKGSKNN
ncbi:MAG: hypothetical protein ACFFD1_15260 [Candidatus Thorarchaeota archaeon]